ncbi:MAG TPA: CocE/NonD family hydrolase C-terminal non-catalytic domain-containing protein [Mycobacteriales bacterium]|nr:CocE/NonD family hydrolase C-terminal non-catalytic domain-containing protein [Mycobacteriales bacterium]
MALFTASFQLQLPGRLEMMGQPIVDLWVTLDRPDAHIAARLDAFDSDGKAIPYASTSGTAQRSTSTVSDP